MRYLLDTGLLIRHLRGQKSTVQLLRALGKTNRLCISTITRLKVKAGAHRDEQVGTQKLLSRFVNFEVDVAVADKAGEIIRNGKETINPSLFLTLLSLQPLWFITLPL